MNHHGMKKTMIPTPMSGHLPEGVGEHKSMFVDQFDIKELTRKKEQTSSLFIRDPKQRNKVLEHSNGKCELCDSVGFHMPSGALYMETHHIITLSEDGADVADNMIALCPNDLREAHYGVQSKKLRREMLSIIPAK
jgi:5-methylcytosine-specific restriction protein A